MSELVASVKKQTFSLAQIKISDILSDVLQSIRRHHVRLEGDFINTVLSILLLEGIGRQLSPELDLFKSALPILRQVGLQMNKDSIKESIANKSAESLISPSMLSMVKIWLFLEARSLASIPVSETDDFMRYDWCVPLQPLREDVGLDFARTALLRTFESATKLRRVCRCRRRYVHFFGHWDGPSELENWTRSLQTSTTSLTWQALDAPYTSNICLERYRSSTARQTAILCLLSARPPSPQATLSSPFSAS